MPRGLVRFQETGQAHFLTWSCYRRCPYLHPPALKDVFLGCLERIRKRYGFRVFGYVVMPEHVHLLVSEPEIDVLATAVQALKLAVYREAAAQGWSNPPFWQKRYYDHNVRSYKSFTNKLRYIHRNPVQRGLCAAPIEWAWSSFRHYATSDPGVVEIESATKRQNPTSANRGQMWGTLMGGVDLAWEE